MLLLPGPHALLPSSRYTHKPTAQYVKVKASPPIARARKMGATGLHTPALRTHQETGNHQPHYEIQVQRLQHEAVLRRGACCSDGIEPTGHGRLRPSRCAHKGCAAPSLLFLRLSAGDAKPTFYAPATPRGIWSTRAVSTLLCLRYPGDTKPTFCAFHAAEGMVHRGAPECETGFRSTGYYVSARPAPLHLWLSRKTGAHRRLCCDGC